MNNLLIILIGIAVFIGGLSAAGTLTPRINHERQEQNLTVSDTVYDLPPEMAVAQAALGTFRGLAINVLWERAETLKNEGKFHEAIKLGTLITKLQPRYPKVWEWVSWNLSYNISAATHTRGERWMWVKSGIDLLQQRGGGIDANPNELSIYQQLGWIYYHKVGEFLDNMSWHYKRELADMWHSILGTPPRDQQAYLRWLQEVVDAPDSAEDLPDGAQRLARWLREQNHEFDRETLRRFTVPTPSVEPASEDSTPVVPRAFDPLVTGGVTEPSASLRPELSWPEWATQADIDALLPFLRKQAITGSELNMDPAYMYKLAERHGPIDWRHPAAHTLYWSQLGLDRISADQGRYLDNEINTLRNVLNALQTLASSGQVVYQPAAKPETSYISYLPALNFWIAYDDYFQTEIVNDPSRSSEAVEEAFGDGHRSHMKEAIANMYIFGDEQAAEQLYSRMLERYKNTDLASDYELPLSDFSFNVISASIDQPQIIRELIVGLITQSITSRIVQRDTRLAEQQYATATRLHDEYRKLNPNPLDPLYQEMPDFPRLHANAIGSFVAGNAGPGGVQQLPLAARAAVYQQLPPEARAMIYLEHGEELKNETDTMGYDIRAILPPPPQEVFDAVIQRMMQAAGQGDQPSPLQGTRPEVR